MASALNQLRTRIWRPDSVAGLIIIAAIVGAGVGVATVVLVEGIDLVADGTRELADILPTDWLWMFVTVPIGLLAAAVIANRLAPETSGDGVPEVAAALVVSGGYVRDRVAALKVVVTSLTLGAGGSAGREGPIVQIGSAIGSAIARRTGLGEDQVRALVAAGAGAGIGASFNAPIAGMLFAMEVILGGFHIRHLNSVVVASVSAAVVSRSLVGADLTFPIVKYPLNDFRELLAYAALGLLAVIVSVAFLRTLDSVETAVARIRSVPWWGLTLGLGLLVAGTGLASTVIVEDGDALMPEVLGTGQEFVGFLLAGGTARWWILLGLIGLKIVATSATLGARASGGAFAPSLFLGAALGAGFFAVIDPVWGFSELRPGAFALVGMSAVFAAVARAPLTSILIVFEITQDYGLVLPLMLATTLATLLTDALHRESVYTMALRRMGVRRMQRSEVDVLDTVQVSAVMSASPLLIDPDATLGEVQGHLDRSRHHGLPVVGGGRLLGVITVTDILRAGGPSDQVLARHAMTPDPVTVTPESPVSLAMERMAALGVGRLPVVDPNDADRVLGVFRREDAVRAYHHALGAATDVELTRERLRQRIGPGADFFEFAIPAGSVADGRPISEVAWPEGCTLVSVRRARHVMVPAGATLLAAGDVITAFGTPGAAERVKARLSPDPGFTLDELGH